MNETLKTIHSMRSVHGDFSAKDISGEDLDTILNACVRAANASARQSYSIIVVQDRAVMKEYLGYAGSKALIFCVDYNRIMDTAKHLKHSYQVEGIIAFITGSVARALNSPSCLQANQTPFIKAFCIGLMILSVSLALSIPV